MRPSQTTSRIRTVRDRARLASRIRGTLAGLWLAAFCVGVALPATELPETASLAAFLARTQPLHSLEKALLGRAGFAAALASGLTAIVILGGTLIFGRFHCSLLCPLGTCQDTATRFATGLRSARKGVTKPGSLKGRTNSFRLSIFAFTIVGIAAGLPAAAALLEPYTVFARGFQRSFGDLTALILNGLEHLGLAVPILTVRWEPFAFVLAILPFGVVILMAVLKSRFFCGELCPTGTLLGLANSAALFRVRLDREACIDCGACARVCRAHCVDGKTLDSSRCVQCLDCLAVCPTGALRYGLPVRVPKTAKAPVADQADQAKEADETGEGVANSVSRRRFLKESGYVAAGTMLALSAPTLAHAAKFSLVQEKPKGPTDRLLAAPPGALSVERFASLCTACGTCVRACPSGVLKHSAFQFGLGRPGVPYLDYGRAFCQYECTACSDACPSGALLDRALDLKKREAIGKSTLVLANCIVVDKGTRCGACAEHCPTGAVRIEKVEGHPLPIPVLHTPTCIGCGACETVCPATPVKAMTVAGLSVHEIADAPRKEPAVPVEKPSEEGFAF